MVDIFLNNKELDVNYRLAQKQYDDRKNTYDRFSAHLSASNKIEWERLKDMAKKKMELALLLKKQGAAKATITILDSHMFINEDKSSRYHKFLMENM